MGKIIVLSGHGSWALGEDAYVKLPARTSIKFYTLNMRTLSDALGGDLDQGKVTGLEPDQVGAPFSSVPDMRLYPPKGLHIQPAPPSWSSVKLPAAVPIQGNLQITIDDKYPGGCSLSVILDYLDGALNNSDETTILWSACRAINLASTGSKLINTLQR